MFAEHAELDLRSLKYRFERAAVPIGAIAFRAARAPHTRGNSSRFRPPAVTQRVTLSPRLGIRMFDVVRYIIRAGWQDVGEAKDTAARYAERFILSHVKYRM